MGDKDKAEIKESKKVSSSVSYANIVTNNIPEIEDNSDATLTPETVAQEEQRNIEVNSSITQTDHINSNLKLTNQSDNKSDATNKFEETEDNLIEPDQFQNINVFEASTFGTCVINRDISNSETYEDNFGKESENSSKILEKFSQINSGNLSKSESSSIEVICEEQNTVDFQDNYIENLVENSDLKESNESQTTELDLHTDKFCCSENSSIYVIESHAETVESEITKKEETQSVYNLSADDIKTELLSISGSDCFIESSKKLCTTSENLSPILDTFFVVEKESEHEPNIIEDTSESTCQLVRDLIENIVEEELDKGKEHIDIEDYCVLEKIKSEEASVFNNQTLEIHNKENNYTSDVINTDDIIEELQQLEEAELSNQIETKTISEVSSVHEFIDKSRTESQEIEIKENNYLPAVSSLDDISTKSQLKVSKLKINKEVEIKVVSNITDTVEEFLQLEKAEETGNKLDLEENQINLLDSQFTELHSEVIELLDSKAEDLDRPKVSLEDPEEVATFLEKEKSEEISEENKQTEMASSQIRVLTLNNQEHQECTLYRIEKNWAIQFRLGPSLFGRKVYLYCNYPVESKGVLAEFNRDRYQLLNWILDEGCKNADDTAVYTQIVAKLAGSFHYYFTFEKG